MTGEVSVWTWLTNAITALAAVGLLSMGIVVALRQTTAKAAAVTALLSFGFLTLVLLQISKFKHVNGFGFEAETWDQKQVQAARLVDELSEMSKALSQQIALLASRLGLWGEGLTNPELASLLRQTENILETAEIPKQQWEESLAPIRQRIALNYWRAADNLIVAAYNQEHNKIIEQTRDETKAQALLGERDRILAIMVDMPHDLEPLITPVRNAKIFKAPPRLMAELGDLDEDLRYFSSNKDTLRRDIDLEKVYSVSSQF
jgi:hypothetical protein